MRELLEKKLILISGKGGVGKTSVALSLGAALAARGKRALVVFVGGHQMVKGAFPRETLGYEPTRLGDQLYAMALDHQKALQEYVLRQIKFEFLYRYVFENRVVKYFLDATPGLKDMIVLGKVISLAEGESKAPFDHILVDLPATGHGLQMLRIPRTVAAMVKVGPLHVQALRMEKMLSDRRKTSLCLVTLPEELPVNEVTDMARILRADLGLSVDHVFVNAVLPEMFSQEDAEAIARIKSTDPMLMAACEAAQSQMHRREKQQFEISRLSETFAQNLFSVPFVFEVPFAPDGILRIRDHLKGALA